MIYNPKIYQEYMYDHIIQYKRCAIWASMGMGKTSGTLHALNTTSLFHNGPALIIAPLRVARGVWGDECLKWNNFKHFDVCPIIGNKEQRKKAMKQHADIFTINYENIPWLIENYKFMFTSIIADEATKLKSFRLRQGAKRSRALAKVAFDKVERFIQLTGTPSPNGLLDLWGQLYFLDRGERLGRTYTAFRDRWFKLTHRKSFSYKPMPHAQKEIEDKVKDICLSLQAKDYFDLKEPIINNIGVDLPPKAQKQYDIFKRDMYLKLENIEISSDFAAATSLKCLQLASGAPYDEDKKYEVVHDEKIYVLKSIINEANGMPVLVSYHFKSDLERLKKHFPKGKLLKTKQDETDFNKGKIPILFVHPASAGHGLNLQYGSNIIVFFSHWWDLEHYLQVIERIGPVRQLQAGFNRPVFIYNIYAKGTVDELVIQNRQGKRRVQDLLLEAAKKERTL